MRSVHDDSIFSWLKQNKLFLFKLGLTYLCNEEEIEKAIDRTNKEIVSEINFKDDRKQEYYQRFLKNCKMLSKEVEGCIVAELNKINFPARQVLYLKYVVQMSEAEICFYLELDEHDVRKFSLMGLTILLETNEKRIVEKLVNYYYGGLSFHDYKEMNEQLNDNENIRKIYEDFLSLTTNLSVSGAELKPSIYFLEQNRPLTKKQLTRMRKNQKLFSISAFLFFSLFLLGSMINFSDLEQKWRNWKGETVGFGEKVYALAVDQNIEILVTHVASDDLQTIIYYEIRDKNDEFHYQVEFYEEMVEVEEKDIWERYPLELVSVPRAFSRRLEDTSVSQGRIFLPPLINEKETITLKFHTVEQIKKGLQDSYAPEAYLPENRKRITGEWVLTIPIQRYEAKIVRIDNEFQIDDDHILNVHSVEVRPTATFLEYSIHSKSNQSDMNFYDLNFSFIEANGKEYLPDFYVDRWRYLSHVETNNRLFPFQSFYFDQPKELSVKLERLNSQYSVHQPIALKYDQLPFEVPFLTTNLTIDIIKGDNSILFQITEPIDLTRPYDQLHFGFQGHDSFYHNGWSMGSEGIWLDEKGTVYDDYEEILELRETNNNLRYITSKQTMEVFFDHHQEITEEMLPKEIVIYSYLISNTLNEKVIIGLN